MAIRMPWIRIAGHDFFVPQQRSMDQQRNYGGGGRGGYGGGLNSGGIVNQGTGLGTGLDKSQGSFFSPTRVYWRTPLEILCVESWTARNAIDIPIDDMFIRWRTVLGKDEGSVKAFEEGERATKTELALNQALKAGDQYGTGAVIMVTAEDTLDAPLDVKRIREGDLKALHYFDRYDLSVTERDYDFQSPNFGKPLWYRVHPAHGVGIERVHHSRVLRFDGIRPPTVSGFTSYDQDFGVSELVPIIVALLEDASGAQSVSHMMQEASIPVLHVAGLRETIAGGGDPNEPTPAEIGQQIRQGMSNFRLLMLDEPGREEFMRVAVQFGGLPEIMDRYQHRVAQARKIPLTRWEGRSPAGMSATGESDMKNYVLMMEAARAKKLRDVMYVLDQVLARNIGMREPPESKWESLLELSDMEIAEASKMKAEALDIAIKAYMMDEDEGRKSLDGDTLFGELPGAAPEAPDPIEEIEAEAKAKASANGNGRQPIPGKK